MTATRPLTLSAHAALDLLLGMAMMAAPALLGFGPRGLILTASLGAILTGMALALSGGPESQQVGRHRHFDSLFVFTAGLAGLWLAVGGHDKEAVFLASIVAIETVVNHATRYVAPN